jgi:pilus assembly protein CpaB
MSRKTWIPLVLALVTGLIAAKLARDVLLRTKPVATGVTETTEVVVAAREVAAGAELGDDDLVLARLPSTSLPAGTSKDAAALVGRVTEARLVKGQAVLDSLLAPPNSAAGLQALVPDGMRALAVEINEFTGVAGHLKPGCRVDVIATVSEGSGNFVTRTVAQAVLVRAVGPSLGGNRTKAEGKNEGSRDAHGENQPPRSVTLLVTPAEAEVIQLATSAATRTSLVLRGRRDKGTSELTGVSLATLRGHNDEDPLAGKGSVQPPVANPTPPQDTNPVVVKPSNPDPAPLLKPKAPRYRTVEVIVGSAVTRVAFPLAGDATATTGDGGSDAIPNAGHDD